MFTNGVLRMDHSILCSTTQLQLGYTKLAAQYLVVTSFWACGIHLRGDARFDGEEETLAYEQTEGQSAWWMTA